MELNRTRRKRALLSKNCSDFVFFDDPAVVPSGGTTDSGVTAQPAAIGSAKNLDSSLGYPLKMSNGWRYAFLPAPTVTPPTWKRLLLVIVF
jgi:hypothetical protein